MIKQVVAAVAATRLLKVGPGCKLIIIQNNGAVDVRLSFDGGSDPSNNKGTLPTVALGFLLKAGQQWIQTAAQFPTIGVKNIWGISATGAAIVLDIVTDDGDSS